MMQIGDTQKALDQLLFTFVRNLCDEVFSLLLMAVTAG